jgi:nitrogenase molybdenum-iron protein alpha/beta subunit
MERPKYLRIYIIGVIIVAIITYLCLHKSSDKSYEHNMRQLSDKSILLMRKNDSLNQANKILKLKIDSIEARKEILKEKKIMLDSRINQINKEQYETHNYINHLSGDNISDEFTKYLTNRSESKNAN